MEQRQTALVAPALTIVFKGEVVTSNFGEFKQKVEGGLARINYAPSTDIEFGEAQEAVKAMEAIEEVIQHTLDEALKASAELNKLFSDAGALKKAVAASRCNLTNKIKERKEQKRSEALRNCIEGVEAKNREKFRAEAEELIKGKKSIDAIRDTLHLFQNRVNAQIRSAKEMLASFEDAHGADLIQDRTTLEVMPLAQLDAELANRLEKKALRDKAAAEAKARREAEEKMWAAQQPTGVQTPPAKPAPTSPPVAPAPKPAAAVTQKADADPVAQEWLAFRTSVQSAAMLIKTGREELKNPENQERAAAMVRTLNCAWLAVQKPENRRILLEQIEAIEAWLKNNK